ncbi:MAG: hypothetical protein ACI8PB_002908 [Desulforhopalus sp.]|jgi:hypothetical protein
MISEVHSSRDMQAFIAMINRCESKGVTDIRAIRTRIEDVLRVRRKDARIITPRKLRTGTLLDGPRYKTKRPLNAVCPKCGSPQWKFSIDADGEGYTLCQACQYSELVK